MATPGRQSRIWSGPTSWSNAPKGGDSEALDRLFDRAMPQLRRRATGRLPRWTRDLRDLMDTDDLVQEAVVRAANRIVGVFEPVGRVAGACVRP